MRQELGENHTDPATFLEGMMAKLSEKKRKQQHGWGKTYVVYSKRLDLLGIHKGPKFMEFEEDQAPYFWPHDIDHWYCTCLVSDGNFRDGYIYIGVL